MAQIVIYKTIEETGTHDLDEKLNELSKEGWSPYMNISTNVLRDNDGESWSIIYSQQLSKLIDVEEKTPEA